MEMGRYLCSGMENLISIEVQSSSAWTELAVDAVRWLV